MTRWVDELAEQAAAALPRDVYDYFRQGAGTHHALHEATPAWDALRLHPRVLRDVTSVRTATTVLGAPVDTPVLVAPTAAQHVVAPGGAVATAFGAAKAGSLVCVSCLTNQPYTEIRDTGAPYRRPYRGTSPSPPTSPSTTSPGSGRSAGCPSSSRESCVPTTR